MKHELVNLFFFPDSLPRKMLNGHSKMMLLGVTTTMAVETQMMDPQVIPVALGRGMMLVKTRLLPAKLGTSEQQREKQRPSRRRRPKKVPRPQRLTRRMGVPPPL